MRHGLAALGWLALACLQGCKRQPEPEPTPAPTPSATARASATGSPLDAAPGSSSAARPSDLGWDVPSGWTRVAEPRPMRLATYRVPRAPGDAADPELTITRAGGTLEANIQRWKAQFSRAPGATTGLRRQQTVNGIVVTILELRGTYLGRSSTDEPAGPSEPPKADYAMVVVVAHVAGAPYFFKLVGPQRSVDAARADLDVLVGSFRPK